MAIDKISNDIESVNGQIIIPNKLAKILSPTQFVRLIRRLIGETSIPWRRYQWESFIQWILNSNTGSKYNINDVSFSIVCRLDSNILLNRHNMYTDQCSL